ncbi:hypothetical protein HOE07_00340, partial [archaeon]|nr:hypothetical protein [archaeon]
MDQKLYNDLVDEVIKQHEHGTSYDQIATELIKKGHPKQEVLKLLQEDYLITFIKNSLDKGYNIEKIKTSVVNAPDVKSGKVSTEVVKHAFSRFVNKTFKYAMVAVIALVILLCLVMAGFYLSSEPYTAPEACTDFDLDGYCIDMDCDDEDPSINPATSEVCDDGIDNNCDGYIDENCIEEIFEAPTTETEKECYTDDDCEYDEECEDNECVEKTYYATESDSTSSSGGSSSSGGGGTTTTTTTDPICGDGVCDSDEDCPEDCYVSVCGDGVCDSDEDCPTDCYVSVCGDGICDSNEDCPTDCEVTVPDITGECGDGVCDKKENFNICPQDCKEPIIEPTEDCEEIKPVCGDGLDNDGDGLIDYPYDPGCLSWEDNDEFNQIEEEEECEEIKPVCGDGKDNDNDDLVDYPNDPGCLSWEDNDEFNQIEEEEECEEIKPVCGDGKDNDGDGLVDYPYDPGCLSWEDNDEFNVIEEEEECEEIKPVCGDGKDNDGDGLVDYPYDP